MTITTKDPVEANNLGKQGSPSQNPAGKSAEGSRSNPVCLELGVTIRSLPSENGGLSTPVRLEGRTVIVFDNGAVLRCAENLPVGQTFILSNPNGRDVVCQVVGGRSLPSIKGYTEVQFMEPVNDFWSLHETTPAPLAAAKVPAQAPAEPVTSSSTHEIPAKPETLQAGNAPSFDDLGGLLSSPATAAPQERKVPLAPPQRAKEPSGPSTYSHSGNATFGMLENLTSVHADQAEEKKAKEAVAEALSNALSTGNLPSSHAAPVSPQVSSANVFSSKGMMAPSHSEPATPMLGGRLPMIGGIIALVLAGAAGGAYVMHRNFDKAPVATAASVSQSATQPDQTAPPSHAPDAAPVADKEQPQAKNVDMEQTPAAASLSAIPAIVSNAGSNEIKSDRKGARQSDSSASSKAQSTAAAAAPRRPAFSNLKMSSPSAPNRNVADSGAGAAPLADMAAAEPATANTSAGLLTASGRISGQPAPPPASMMPPPVPAITQAKAGKAVPPKLISSAHLAYPPSAKDAAIQGTVTIQAMVGPSGAVYNVRALNGPVMLRQAAVDSVRLWKYSPGTVDGTAAAAQITVAVEFKLK